MVWPKKPMRSHPDFKLKMTKLGCQGSQIKNFQESFFSFKTTWELMKEISRSIFFQKRNVREHFVMLRIASILSINYKEWLKKMDFYSKILYSKDLEFTYHSKIKMRLLKKKQNTYAFYEACNPSIKIKN